MLLIIDEDLPIKAAEFLRSRGYEVLRIVEMGLAGTKDHDLWPLVQKARGFFITADKGFADLRRYPPGDHVGVLLLRPDHEGVVQFVRLLERVVDRYAIAELQTCVVVASERSIRVRRTAT